ncbi:MAG: sugar transferase [Armatimonadota bacterium]
MGISAVAEKRKQAQVTYGLFRRLDEVLRRAIDIALSLFGLVLTGPAILFCALLVKATSPGPAFYCQERVGRHGRPFRIFKLRTMEEGSSGPQVVALGDVRVTPLGRFLRRYKLDELPQLVNVLAGHMSLVGPRPEVPHFVAFYNPSQRRVLDAKPGITGPVQIRYHDEARLLAGASDPEHVYITKVMPAKLAMDLEYLKHRTVLTDVVILLQTLRILLCSRR